MEEAQQRSISNSMGRRCRLITSLPERGRSEGLDPYARFRRSASELPPSNDFGLVTTLLLHSSDFSQVESQAVRMVAEAVRTNPHITCKSCLSRAGRLNGFEPELLRKILEVCYSSTSYLDRFYSLQPGHLLGAKRLFVLLPLKERSRSDKHGFMKSASVPHPMARRCAVNGLGRIRASAR